jgi:two-component system, NarL family, nitrate/nitrite response regulator NarL
MRSRLLIVDDNARFVEAAKDFLQREGCEVVAVASTGAEASRLAREFQPDAVLVDVDLGPESGFEVAARLVADNELNVVLISVDGEAEFADVIAKSPALGFISKAHLSARAIADVLDRGRPPASE